MSLTFLKKFTLLFIFLFILLFFQKNNLVFSQESKISREQALCYSQCTAYKFLWQGDFCYDLLTAACGEKVSVKDVVDFTYNIYRLLRKNALEMWVDVDNVFKAWFVYKPLIEDCIVPQLNNCRQICSQNLSILPQIFRLAIQIVVFAELFMTLIKINYILKR